MQRTNQRAPEDVAFIREKTDPTRSVRKYCNENRRSQPSQIIIFSILIWKLVQITRLKIERETKNMRPAQVRQRCNFATNKATISGRKTTTKDWFVRTCVLHCKSITFVAIDPWRAIWKNCLKPFGCSAAQGGYRIRLRPQWAGWIQRRPRTQAFLNQVSRKAIAWRTKDTTEKRTRESFWIAFKTLQRSLSSA